MDTRGALTLKQVKGTQKINNTLQFCEQLHTENNDLSNENGKRALYMLSPLMYKNEFISFPDGAKIA